MATVTFEIDDAIYKKANELLQQEGLVTIEIYLKAVIEQVVAMAARGETKETVTMDKLEDGLDKVRHKVKRIQENREEEK